MDDLDLGATIRGFSAGQKVFGRFVLQRVLGRGGMGVVWLARDEKLDEPVALKFLPEVVKLDPGALDDLKRETKRARQLTHPNIVRIHDFLEDAHAAAIAMEAVEGTTLAQRRVEEPNRAFAPAALRDWLRQLCTTLDYAHLDARVVHRDLKPANVMVDARGRVKITDFGISQSLSDSLSRASVQRSSSGTPAYMSPQQMMGGKPSPADDIYALGATVYELLTSRPPFHSGNLIAQVQSVVPPPMAARRADLDVPATEIPPEWEVTIAACLAKEPAERPRTAGEVWTRLNTPAPAAVTSVAPAAPARPPAPATPTEPPLLRPRASVQTVLTRALILVVILGVILVAGAAFWWIARVNRTAFERAGQLQPGPAPAKEAPAGPLAGPVDSASLVAPWTGAGPAVAVVLPAGWAAQATHALAVAGDEVYAAATLPDGRAALLRVDPSAGTAAALHLLRAPVAIAALGDDLYWVDPNSGPVTDTQVWKAPRQPSTDAPPVAIYTGSAVGEPIVDGGGIAVQLDLSEEVIFGNRAPAPRLLVVDQLGGRVAAIVPETGAVRVLVERRYGGGFASAHAQAIASDNGAGFIVAGSGRAGVATPEILHFADREGGLPAILWSGAPLVAPRAVARIGDVVYVADPAAGNAIWCLPHDGLVIYRLPVPAEAFQRIEALAVTEAGELLVADAGNGAIVRIGDLPTREALLFGARFDADRVTFSETGLGLLVEQEGSGEPATDGQRVTVQYLAYDAAENFVGHTTRDEPRVIVVGEQTMGAGLDEALRQLRPGATARLYIPPALGSANFFREPKPTHPGGAVVTLVVESIE